MGVWVCPRTGGRPGHVGVLEWLLLAADGPRLMGQLTAKDTEGLAGGQCVPVRVGGDG